MVNAPMFQADFPEFACTSTYPDGQINFWLTLAGKLLRPDAWQDLLDQGTELFVAHNLSLPAGANSGLVTSKSIDKVSVSYSATAGVVEGGGNFNLTTYGTRYLWLVNLVGAGGMQLNVGPVDYPDTFGVGILTGTWGYGGG